MKYNKYISKGCRKLTTREEATPIPTPKVKNPLRQESGIDRKEGNTNLRGQEQDFCSLNTRHFQQMKGETKTLFRGYLPRPVNLQSLCFQS